LNRVGIKTREAEFTVKGMKRMKDMPSKTAQKTAQLAPLLDTKGPVSWPMEFRNLGAGLRSHLF